MKKKVLFLLILSVLLIHSAFALNVKTLDKGSVIISELGNPAVFDFTISSGNEDNIEIFSFVGLTFSPRGAFTIKPGDTTIEVRAYPNDNIRSQKGIYYLEYQIKGQGPDIYKSQLAISVVPLKEAFELKSQHLNLGDKEAIISLKNTQNTNIENVNVRFVSQFFNSSEEVSFKPYEQINVTIPVNVNSSKSLLAGAYIVKAKIDVANAKTEIEGTIRYIEKESVKTERDSSGLIVRKTTITKRNEGNVPSTAQIEVKKTIVGRLFTVNSLEPLIVERSGLLVSYVWEKELQPGESYFLTTTTNYTMPFIFILFIIIIALFVKMYSRTSVVLNKRVSFVKTRGGEFALKVIIRIKARSFVEDIQVIDRLPGMTQLYEKFGIKPDKIDSGTRRLFWNIDRLNAGEERVYSYIVYSRVKVVGRFELPSATAVYLKDGRTEEAFSNRTFFVAESGRSDVV